MKGRALFRRIAALFYPHRCFICDKAVPYPDTVCETCAPKIIRYPQIRGAVCDVCGLPLKQCGCRPNRLYEKAVFPLFYEGEARHSVHRLKFRGRLDKAKPFAAAMKTALEERDVLEQTDLLTFIPMTRQKQRSRGYNQAEQLCRALQEQTGLPMLPLLYKYADNGTQHDLPGALYRTGNILGVYEPDPRYVSEIEGKRILLVDDVLTSGATLNEAAKTLLIFGAQTVNTVTCAAVRKPEKQTKQKEKAGSR